jgi:hypothetical protein
MASHPRPAWTRLGELLMRRRIDLDPRYRNRRLFTAERAVEYRIVNDIELGNRDNYEPGTIAALEGAYAVAPGSIGRALEGGELEPLGATPADVRRDRELPIIASLKAAPGIGPYRAAVDAERAGGGFIVRDEEEFRIWADPKLTEDEKRTLVAYGRLEQDKAVRSSQEDTGLMRA